MEYRRPHARLRLFLRRDVTRYLQAAARGARLRQTKGVRPLLQNDAFCFSDPKPESRTESFGSARRAGAPLKPRSFVAGSGTARHGGAPNAALLPVREDPVRSPRRDGRPAAVPARWAPRAAVGCGRCSPPAWPPAWPRCPPPAPASAPATAPQRCTAPSATSPPSLRASLRTWSASTWGTFGSAPRL